MSRIFLYSFLSFSLFGGVVVLAQSDRHILQKAEEPQGRKEFRTSSIRQYLEAYAARRKEDFAKGPRALKDTKADQISDMERRKRNVRAATQSRISGVLEDRREELEKLWEGRGVLLSPERKERIEDYTETIRNDLERAIQNLTVLTGKLETYVAAQSPKETDTVKIKAKIESVKNKIAEANVAYDLVTVSLNAISEGENPAQKLDEARVVFGEAERIVADARDVLRGVVDHMSLHE